jgi:hypothetical protein
VLTGKLGGDVDPDGAKTGGGFSKGQRESAVLAIVFQAFEEPVLVDSPDLAKMGEPGPVTFKGFGAVETVDDLFYFAAMFLRDFHGGTPGNEARDRISHPPSDTHIDGKGGLFISRFLSDSFVLPQAGR